MEQEKDQQAAEKRKFKLATRHHVAIAVCIALLILAATLLISLFDKANPTPAFIRSTDIYRMAFDKAKASKAVHDAIGEPIGVGTSFNGSIEEGEASGKAQFTVNLSSKQAKGVLEVEASKSKGVWKLERLDFTPKGAAEPMNLLLEP